MSGINRAALVLSAFAALWGCVALSELHLTGVLLLASPAVSLVLIWWRVRNLPTTLRSVETQHRVRRVVLTWSAIEFVALIVAANSLRGNPALLASTAAVLIGLHFLPMAAQLPQRVYWATGLTLIAVGLMSLFVPEAWRTISVAAPSALILWLTAAVIRDPIENDDRFPSLATASR